MKHRMAVLVVAGLALGGMSLASVFAGPGDGIKVNDWTLQPYVSPFVMYDSNVLLDENNAQDDVSYGVRYGATVDRALDWYAFSGSLWGMSEWFDDTTALNHDDFGDTLNLSLNTAGGTRVSLGQEFIDQQSVDYAVGNVQRVLINRASVGAGRSLGEKADVDVAYAFQSHDYADPFLYDWNQNRVKGSAGYAMTDKSAGFLSASVGVQKSDGNDHSGTSYNSILGVRTRSTDKIVASAGLGVLGLESPEDDIATLSYEASVAWKALEKMTVTAGADKLIQPAVISRNNYLIADVMSAGITYAILDSLQMKLLGEYEHHELSMPYAAADGSEIKKKEDIVAGTVRAEYQCPAKFLKVFAEYRAADQNSSETGLDYSDQKVSAGLQLQY